MKKKLNSSATANTTDGKTNWQALQAMPDTAVTFTDDAPATSPQDWADATVHRGLPAPPGKTQIALRVDNDVLAWFKNQGTGYQTRMNAVLKAFRNAHTTATP